LTAKKERRHIVRDPAHQIRDGRLAVNSFKRHTGHSGTSHNGPDKISSTHRHRKRPIRSLEWLYRETPDGRTFSYRQGSFDASVRLSKHPLTY
jgi:hypothetical protein